MTKQEKIQEAWIIAIGIDAYESDVKGFIDDNGWVDIKIYLLKDDYLQSRPIREGLSPVSFLRRPILLEGIDNNNGWVKIYIESDLPKKDLECYVTNAIGRIQFGEFEKETESFFVNNDRIFPTHYQKIIKPNYPIY